MKSISIHCGNVTPSAAEVDHESVIACWLQVEDYFSSHSVKFDSNTTLDIRVDSSKVREKLDWLKPENCEEFFENYVKSGGENLFESFISNHPFSAELYVEIVKDPPGNDWDEGFFIRSLLEQIFLAMNISERGGCNYGSISVNGKNSDHSLHCGVIESGWHKAEQHSWPRLTPMRFSDVWKWLERNGGLAYMLADTPALNAISTLTHLSYRGDIDATKVIQVSQALESLYLYKGEPKVRGLSRKVPAVLGDLPVAGKKWLANFYRLRSDIVHGDFPVFRPRYGEVDKHFEQVSDRYWEISQAIDFGVSIIVSTIQNMVISDADIYKFSEEIIVHPARRSD